MTNPPQPPTGADVFTYSNGDRHTLRILAVGTLAVVNDHVMRMYQMGYAQPHEWSKPLPTVNPNEVMRILTKRIIGLTAD